MANRPGNIFDQYLNDLPPEVRARMNQELGEKDTGDEKVKVTVNDVAAGRLTDKLAAGTNVTLTTVNPGGNEQLRIDTPNSIAYWSTSLVRYFLVDYDGGDDANAGYVDAAAGVTITPAGVAIKTLEQLFNIMPTIGNGRDAVVLIKPRDLGAAYLKKDGVTADSIDFSRFHGYRVLMVRGSNLTNTESDKQLLGGVIAADGPGDDGEWTCAAGATSWGFSISTGSLSAEPALLGYRVRFTGNVTSALANLSYMINANTTSTIKTADKMNTLPAAGDTFYVEKPGVVLASFKGAYDTSYDFVGTHLVAGVSVSGSANMSFMPNGNNTRLTFCAATAVTGNSTLTNTPHVAQPRCVSYIDVTHYFIDEAGTTINNVGFGARVLGTANLAGAGTVLSSAFLGATSCAQFWGAQDASNVRLGGAGCVFASTVSITNTNAPANTMMGGSIGPGASIGFGSNANLSDWSYTKTRILGANLLAGLLVYQSSIAVYGVEITGVGDNYGIWVNAQGATLEFDDIVGSSGNNWIGIMFQAANCSSYFGRLRAVTLTGVYGDIWPVNTPTTQVSSSVISYASLNTTNVVDVAGNQYFGAGGTVVGQCSLLYNASGASIALGEVVRSSGVSGRIVKAQADSQVNADSPIGVMVTAAINNQHGYVADAGSPWVQFTAAPVVGSIAYLSDVTAGQATTTVPSAGATRKLRLGRVVAVTGTLGRVAWKPETLSDAADGNP